MKWFSLSLTVLVIATLSCQDTNTPAPKENTTPPPQSSPSPPTKEPAPPRKAENDKPKKDNHAKKTSPKNDASKVERLILEWERALDSPDPQVRAFAAISLLLCEQARAARTLKAALQETSSPEKRAAIIKAYGFQKDDSITDLMAAALADKNAEVSAAASWALANLGTRAATKELLTFLGKKDNPDPARVFVAKAIGRTHSEEAVEPLIKCLEPAAPNLREAAHASLVEITRNESLGMDQKKWEEWWQRNRFRTRQEWLDEKISSLKNTAEDLRKSNTEIRSELADKTIKALEQRTDKKAPEPLLEALKNPEGRVRLYAAQELARLDVPARVPALIGVLSDPDAEVRRTAAGELGEAGDRKAEAPLITALKDKDAFVRTAAASSLGQLGSKAGVPALIGLLNDSDVEAAGTAAAALGDIGEKSAVEPLIRVLSNGKNRTKAREAAAAALGKLGDGSAAKPLIAVLRDEDERVRWFAAIALGQLKTQDAIVPLSNILANDANANVRLSAATSLGMIGNPKAEPCLAGALNDKDPKVAAQAADVLLMLAGENFDTLLRIGSLFQDRKDDNRMVKVLGKLLDNYKGDSTRKEQIASVRKMLAEAFVRLKQWGAARQQYAELYALNPKDTALRQEFLNCLTNDGDYIAALATCKDALKQDPDHASDLWNQIAELIEKYHTPIGQADLDKIVAELETEHPDLGGEAIKQRIAKYASPKKAPASPPKAEEPKGKQDTQK